MSTGSVVTIHLAAEKAGDLRRVDSVRAFAGAGLEGDRYENRAGGCPAKRQATLIEAEAIAAVEREHRIALGPGESRRNITTRGVELNPLVGREFSVGEVRLRGIELCEPCGYLEKLTMPGVREALRHRGGLRAEILSDGVIRVGDPVSAE